PETPLPESPPVSPPPPPSPPPPSPPVSPPPSPGGPPVSPPPPPPPPPPAEPVSTSLIDLSSHSFSALGARAIVTFPGNGSSNGSTHFTTMASVEYRRPTGEWFVWNNDNAAWFYPEDLDPDSSSETADVYIKTDGNLTDTLTLLKPGTSGPLRYQYVGAAYWQRTIVNDPMIGGNLTAMIYGFRTPYSSVPRTGRASYDVDLIGVRTLFDSVGPLAGKGVAQIDFATGAVVTHGSLLPEVSGFPSSARFSSEARIAAGGAFAGNFRLSDFSEMTGDLQGALFGPDAQEFGASFAGGSGAATMVGTLTGRGAAVTSTNADVSNPTVNAFYTGHAAKLTTQLQGQSGHNTGAQTFSDASVKAESLIVNYDADYRAYTLMAPDRSEYFLGSRSRGTVEETLQTTTPLKTLYDVPYAVFGDMKSVGSQLWYRREGIGGNTRYTFEPFVFGSMTAFDAMPRTGSADYAIGLTGFAADNDFPNLAKLSGFGFLNADFATGALSASGQVRYAEDYQISSPYRATTRTGRFSATGTISNMLKNNFSGAMQFTGIGDYTGTMNGAFFGANAGEIGASFSALDGLGGSLVGTFTGGLDPVGAVRTPAIADLTTPTNLSLVESRPGLAVSAVRYDPSSRSYTLSVTNTGAPGIAYTAEINPADRQAPAPAGAFDTYATTVLGSPAIGRLLKTTGNDPALTFTYSSLAAISGVGNADFQNIRNFVAFGVPTPQLDMPIGGTATYSGLAIGAGRTGGNVFELDGTSSFLVDFQQKTFTSALNMTGRDIVSGSVTPYATMRASGYIGSNMLVSNNTTDGLNLSGQFFGPDAKELGGTFRVAQPSGSGMTEMSGAFLAKK
ncbi:MAG: hypothetical protein EON61_12060, partial [Alphaproteobacteria bacterium]